MAMKRPKARLAPFTTNCRATDSRATHPGPVKSPRSCPRLAAWRSGPSPASKPRRRRRGFSRKAQPKVCSRWPALNGLTGVVGPSDMIPVRGRCDFTSPTGCPLYQRRARVSINRRDIAVLDRERMAERSVCNHILHGCRRPFALAGRSGLFRVDQTNLYAGISIKHC